MKAGILLPQTGDCATRENVLYIAKEAEKEGLDSLWVSFIRLKFHFDILVKAI
jgi:hypothetical protein